MGVKRTVVSTAVSRAIPDDRLPNAVQQGILKSLLEEDASMVDYIQEELVNCLGIRAEQMYDYAARGAYEFGLPSGKFTTGGVASDAVEAVLTAIEGAPVELSYAHYGAANDLHIGWMQLMANYGYNPATNELTVLSAAKGAKVYLDDMAVVVPTSQLANLNPESLELWGISTKAGYTPERTTLTPQTAQWVAATPVQSDPGATAEHLKVDVIWQGVSVLTRDSFTLPIEGFDSNANYFQVRYVVGSTVKYWIYKAGSGTYPSLDQAFDPPHSEAGSFFPFTYFRFNKKSEIADKTTSSYKAGTQLMRRLGLAYDQIAEAIDGNPDIDQVEQAMMMFAVPANTDNEEERRYLFGFFDNLYLSHEYGDYRASTPESAEVSGVLGDPMVKPSIVIQDTRFKMSVEFTALYKRRVAGTIGKVGTHDSGQSSRTSYLTVHDTESDQDVQMPVVEPYHYYRRQVSTGFYDEIQVVSLRTVYFILGDFKQAVGQDDSDILLIPLDRSLIEEFSIPIKEKLYARAMYYVFNSVVIVHLKWYQTELFQGVLIVVAIVLTVLSWGSTLPALYGLLAAGAYGAAAYLILEMLIQYLVLYLAFKTVVRIFGAKIALVIAIIAAVVGMGGALQEGGVAAAPWAGQLLQVSTGLTSAISAKEQADMADLMGQAKQLEQYEKDQTKLLESAQELLGGKVTLDPFVIFGETPHDYYNRTVHSGNIGVIGIDAVSSFVETKLQLPTLQDSIGGY